eukprot:CAMPEP_0171098668 /NCGR_PEP_ID=MMETSP0766_2-20121228/49049_1 /TAXON_ID=439317 /ORGANISM="Gambierdiscus australes, Strain CAWD 149" /LENGTH=61 /DNA_ID=CAMNT_0011558069 /DNA_START=11 /DNA_END=193 /DNA_ORIENTATION=+
MTNCARRKQGSNHALPRVVLQCSLRRLAALVPFGPKTAACTGFRAKALARISARHDLDRKK